MNYLLCKESDLFLCMYNAYKKKKNAFKDNPTMLRLPKKKSPLITFVIIL